MTGRDENMREGTLASLSERGFPQPDGRRTILILKPRFDTLDLEYKTEALARLKDLGAVAGGFENEPVHVNLFHDAFPQSRMILVETKHSEQAGPALFLDPPDQGLPARLTHGLAAFVLSSVTCTPRMTVVLVAGSLVQLTDWQRHTAARTGFKSVRSSLMCTARGPRRRWRSTRGR